MDHYDSQQTNDASPKRTGMRPCLDGVGEAAEKGYSDLPGPSHPLPGQLGSRGSGVLGAHERGRGMRGRSEVGCWVTGAGRKGERPGPRARGMKA